MAKSYSERNRESIRRTGKSLYQRRIDRAQAQGKTRQAARGHKPQEHRRRAERAAAAGRLTEKQKAAARRFYDRQGLRAADDDKAAFTRKDFVALVGENGFPWFERLKARLIAREDGWRQSGSPSKGYMESGLEGLEDDMEGEDLPLWFGFYH